MSIKANMKTPTKAFTELMTDYETKFNEAVLKSKLPDEPDLNAVNDLMIKITIKFLGKHDRIYNYTLLLLNHFSPRFIN